MGGLFQAAHQPGISPEFVLGLAIFKSYGLEFVDNHFLAHLQVVTQFVEGYVIIAQLHIDEAK